jgi:zinc protease
MLPRNPHCNINTLPNGLTYYIQSNPNPAGRVVLRLVVKKGSMHESESQRGLAHFLEHCAFRATKNYPDGKLIHYLQSLGSAFGPDVNAATSLTHTIYKLTVPTTPTTSADDVNKKDFCSHSNNNNNNSLYEALKVLAEWAYRIRISQDDVDAERNIILEEWRGRQGSSQRMLHTYWDKIFGTTKWSKRMPIGLVNIIKSCTANDIQEFYSKHYDPKHMALIIVGDFGNTSLSGRSNIDSNIDIAKIENMIKDIFLLPRHQKYKFKPSLTEQFVYPDHKKTVLCIAEDKEYRRTNMSLEYFHPIQHANTIDFLKNELYKRVVTSALDNRLRQLVKNMVEFQDEPTSLIEVKSAILTGGVSLNSIVPGLNRLSITLRLSEATGSQVYGINVLAREMIRLNSFGFTENEVEIGKRKWISTFKAQKNNVNQLTSNSIVSDCIEHFLSDFKSIFAGTEMELDLSLQEMRKVSVSDVNEYVKRLFPLPNFSIHSQLPSTKSIASDGTFQAFTIQRGINGNDAKFDELQLHDLWYDALNYYAVLASKNKLSSWPEDDKLFVRRKSTGKDTVFVENIKKEIVDAGTADGNGAISLISKSQKQMLLNNKGSVIGKKYLPRSDAHEWTLSNGINIIWKRTNYQKEKFSFQGFCLGGKTGLNAQDDVVFGFLDDVATESGLGDFNGNYINNLSHTNTRVNTQSHLLFKGIGGSGMNNENAELLFEMLYLKFTNQPFDEKVLTNITGRYKQLLSSSEKSAEYEFLQYIKREMYGNVPAFQELSVDKINKFVSLGNMQSLFKQEFIDNSNQFTFSFCGDLPTDEIFEEYVVTYLGQLTGGDKNIARKKQLECMPKQIDVILPTKIEIHKSMRRVLTDKCDVMIVFNIELPDQNKTVEFATMSKCFSHIATTELRKEIREKRSGVYNISMDVDYSSLAKHALFIVQFSCNPENSDELVQHVHSVLEKIKSGEAIEPEDVKTMKTIMTKQHELRLKNNSNWLFWLLDSKKMEKYLSLMNIDSKNHKNNDAIGKKKGDWLDNHLYERHKGHVDYVNSVDKRRLVHFASSFLDMKHYRVFMLLPKDKMAPTSVRKASGVLDVVNQRQQLPISSLAIDESSDKSVNLVIERTNSNTSNNSDEGNLKQ